MTAGERDSLQPSWSVLGLILALGVFLVAGCAAPIGADRVPTQQAYAQIEANAISSGKPSASTASVLHRYGLSRLAARQPDEAVRQLHEKAVATGDRGLLFTLAELSYVAAEQIRQSVKPWDPRDARDYYLGSAIYAWLYLFGDRNGTSLDPFDRRFREACDFYNYSLGLALTERRSTNGIVELGRTRRKLPVGEIELRLDLAHFPESPDQFEQILLADQFRIRGLSLRNREGGLGAPLIFVNPLNEEFRFQPSTPATVFLRGPSSLQSLAASNTVCPLELYATLDNTMVAVGNGHVPLEIDRTTFRAYTLRQGSIWQLGRVQFLTPAGRVRSQVMLNQPFDPNRIPIVFVHGTFASPVTWAEMANTLIADPVIRERFQIWSFVYGSGNPLIHSVADLRVALTDEIRRRDPLGTNAALRQMVLIGHSQGGLLAKGTAIHAEDRLWRALNTNRLDQVKMDEKLRAELHRLLFLEPLPFVNRVIFIATPHRGSYLSGHFVRRLASRVVSLPSALVASASDLMQSIGDGDMKQFFQGRVPTSLDGMSPRNPGLLAMAELPVAPPIKSHSIIAMRDDRVPAKGRDGLVAYASAHVPYTDSECIVRSSHGCLKQPATIEEVRRILYVHLKELPSASP